MYRTNRYQCQCGRKFEEVQEKSEKSAECPYCGTVTRKMLFPCPQVRTDTNAWQEIKEDFTNKDRALYEKIARREGVSTTGKKFVSQLADRPGDPQAWVSDLDDIRRIAREKNLEVDGIVKHKAVKDIAAHPLDKPYEVADSIVHQEIAGEEAQRGAPFEKKQKRKKFEELKSRMSGH